MPNGWKPMPLKPPYRVMVTGSGTNVFFEATDEERMEQFLPRFKQMIAEWEEVGARPLSSFVDDVFQVGEADAPYSVWYLLFEVDSLDVAAQLLQASRQTVDGVRLDRWIRLRLQVGRPFFASEEHEPHFVIDPDSAGYRP